MDFWTSYLEISQKLRKRFMRKPNFREASRDYERLYQQLKRQGNGEYAALCSLAIARCHEATGERVQHAERVLDAGRLLLSSCDFDYGGDGCEEGEGGGGVGDGGGGGGDGEGGIVDLYRSGVLGGGSRVWRRKEGGFLGRIDDNDGWLITLGMDCYLCAIHIYEERKRVALAGALCCELAVRLRFFGRYQEAVLMYEHARVCGESQGVMASVLASLQGQVMCKCRVRDYEAAVVLCGEVIDLVADKALHDVEQVGFEEDNDIISFSNGTENGDNVDAVKGALLSPTPPPNMKKQHRRMGSNPLMTTPVVGGEGEAGKAMEGNKNNNNLLALSSVVDFGDAHSIVSHSQGMYLQGGAFIECMRDAEITRVLLVLLILPSLSASSSATWSTSKNRRMQYMEILGRYGYEEGAGDRDEECDEEEPNTGQDNGNVNAEGVVEEGPSNEEGNISTVVFGVDDFDAFHSLHLMDGCGDSGSSRRRHVPSYLSEEQFILLESLIQAVCCGGVDGKNFSGERVGNENIGTISVENGVDLKYIEGDLSRFLTAFQMDLLHILVNSVEECCL
eukprot:Nk52_evm13s254 gene=Nk52_evmTU13s254